MHELERYRVDVSRSGLYLRHQRPTADRSAVLLTTSVSSAMARRRSSPSTASGSRDHTARRVMKRLRRTVPTLAVETALVLATLVVGSLPVWASPGDLDPRFGGGDGWAHAGFSSLDGRPADDRGEDFVVQPDGRIIVLGVSDEDRLPRMAMIRFLPDGSPDPAFGAHHSGRRIITAPGIEPGSTWPADIALLPDGKIVVAST